MPAGGGTARAEQIATLQGIAHQQLVSSDTERLLGTGSISRRVLPSNRTGNSGTNRPMPCCVKCGVTTVAQENSRQIS